MNTIHALTLAAATGILLAVAPARASSHREAPNLTENPKVDATDFYLFRSYEPGREDFVTIVANYLPLQDPYGGPNYFALDPDALYEIHVDNDGDAVEDVTFQFRFENTIQDVQLTIGPVGNQKQVSIPLVNVGAIDMPNDANLNVRESYTVKAVFGDRRTGMVEAITNADSGSPTFVKPVDNIGDKSIADYAAYAAQHVYPISLPDGSEGRVFVGQRKDPFVVNLGETFDLVHFDPLGSTASQTDDLADKNVTSLVLELPIDFLSGTSTVIGGWTSASLRQARVINPAPLSAVANAVTVEGGAWTQVSRLGMPLVNELVIGLKDKDRFNASEPKDDAQFLDYVTHPTLPALLEVLFPAVTAPTAIPRDDLVAVFLTGIAGVNATATPSEMVRLNTATAATPAANQNNLGVVAGDSAGFPNGRRPGDDVVDLALRVVMGKLIADPLQAPSGQLPFTDGAIVDATFFDAVFPYLVTPLPGSPSAP